MRNKHKYNSTKFIMKHFLFFIYMASFILVGCQQKTNNISSAMTEEEWRASLPEGSIVINADFNPTAGLSDELINTPIEALVLLQFGDGIPDIPSYYYVYEGTQRVRDKTSNIAKLYLIERPIQFYVNNSDFVWKVLNNARNKKREKIESEALKNWEKYE